MVYKLYGVCRELGLGSRVVRFRACVQDSPPLWKLRQIAQLALGIAISAWDWTPGGKSGLGVEFQKWRFWGVVFRVWPEPPKSLPNFGLRAFEASGLVRIRVARECCGG